MDNLWVKLKYFLDSVRLSFILFICVLNESFYLFSICLIQEQVWALYQFRPIFSLTDIINLHSTIWSTRFVKVQLLAENACLIKELNLFARPGPILLKVIFVIDYVFWSDRPTSALCLRFILVVIQDSKIILLSFRQRVRIKVCRGLRIGSYFRKLLILAYRQM